MKRKVALTIGASVVVVLLGIALGSVWLPPGQVLSILGHRMFGLPLPDHVPDTAVAILWNLRLPRALLAFLAGAALSVSGAVMQAVLRNPLASSYTLGVSAGASLGACLVLIYGVVLPLVGALTLPIVGFLFGVGTMLLAVVFAARLDRQMESHTIILVGVVFTLFVGAVTTLLAALERESLQRLIFWQMGSFSGQGFEAIWILLPVIVIGTLWILRLHRELDMMTFGESQAMTMGVDLKRVKWTLLILAAAVTGSTISFVGVIGFVDLVVPHIVRRIFGASHRLVIPMAVVLGGAFMVVADLVARTVVPHTELPVGVVTALIGAPFFVLIYRQGRAKSC